MEYVRGTTLDELMARRGPIPPAVFAPVFERLCEVVYSAHELGIVHRDIKLSNVMVVERAGQLLPKLLDFGIAKIALTGDYDPSSGDPPSDAAEVSVTGHGALIGSPPYMAPRAVDRRGHGRPPRRHLRARRGRVPLPGRTAAAHRRDPASAGPRPPVRDATAARGRLRRARRRGGARAGQGAGGALGPGHRPRHRGPARHRRCRRRVGAAGRRRPARWLGARRAAAAGRGGGQGGGGDDHGRGRRRAAGAGRAGLPLGRDHRPGRGARRRQRRPAREDDQPVGPRRRDGVARPGRGGVCGHPGAARAAGRAGRAGPGCARWPRGATAAAPRPS
jgi:hypothetical protein